MPGHTALPTSLLRGCHDRATLAAHGVGQHELLGPLWTRTNHGLWAWSATQGTTAERILRAVPLVRGGGAVGGWAAAFVHGHHDLDGETPDGEPLPVLLCLPRACRCRRTRDVRVFRSDLDESDVVEVAGTPVTSPTRTCADLARLTTPLAEAVAAVDALARQGAEVIGEADAWLRQHPRWTGVRRAQHVLAVARSGVRSPGESRLRMLWTLDAGLPTPQVNCELLHVDGYSLGIADLVDLDAGLVGEYDGGHHAGAAQRSIDHARREALQHAGLLVVQHTAADLGEKRGLTVARLRRLHAEGMRRDRSRDRWFVPAR